MVLLQHPAYSPDLVPSDYFLFPNLKKWLGGRRFTSNDDIIAQTNEYFAELPKPYFLLEKTFGKVCKAERRLC